MVKNERVRKGIDYIVEHLEEDISVDNVASFCNYSKFYFERVFKVETGESIYAFIKRLKMEQSALNLRHDRDKSITEIGVNYGYSSSNYSSAFSKHHQISPVQFRKRLNTSGPAHPFNPDAKLAFQSFEEYDRHIRIEEMGPFTVVCERHIGNYLELDENWRAFTERYEAHMKEHTLLIERFYDDPTVTRVEQCLYDLCMTVKADCALDNVVTLEKGKFAVCRFEGAVSDIFMALQGVFSVWLPQSPYEMDQRYVLNIYRAIDREAMRVVLDLCIPIKHSKNSEV